ncbi:MAG TPA: hypothetical protein VGC81_12710 [Candidatus Methylomirabilis sp.]
MRTRLFLLPLLAGMLALPAVGQAQSDKSKSGKAPWIHIRVTEADDEAKVSVNLPMSLVEVALDLAEDEIATEGRIQLDNSDITVADMRRMWKELREAGDADFIEAEEDDEIVKVFRKGDVLFVNVDDRENGEEKVRLEIPVGVVDALFSDDEGLNLRGALAELNRLNKGQILTVHDGDSHVRIWID